MLLHAASVSLRVSPLRKLRNQRFQVPPCSWLYVSQLPFGETEGYLVSPISRDRIPPFRSATNKPGRPFDTAENMSPPPGKNDISSTSSSGGVIGLSMSSDRSKARLQMRARPWSSRRNANHRPSKDPTEIRPDEWRFFLPAQRRF